MDEKELTKIQTLFTTSVDPLALTLQRIRNNSEGLRNQVKAQVCDILECIWHNPYGLAPQQVFDAIGTKAAGIISAKAILWPLLLATCADDPPKDPKPEGVDCKVNADGTVTVVYPQG